MSTVIILMPVFNEAENISMTIKSIQAQTYSDWTLIIHDNCSQDSTHEIAQDLARRDLRIRVYKSEFTVGIQDNWEKTANIVLADFESDYLIWMGGDDLWSSNEFLKNKIDFLEENPEFSCVSSAVGVVGSPPGSAINIHSTSGHRIMRVFQYVIDYKQINVLWSLIPRHIFSHIATHTTFKLGGFRGFDWYFGLGLFYSGRVGFDPESDYLKRIRLNSPLSYDSKARLSILSKYLSFMQPYIETFWGQKGRLRGLPFHILTVVITCQFVLSHFRLLRMIGMRFLKILSIQGIK